MKTNNRKQLTHQPLTLEEATMSRNENRTLATETETFRSEFHRGRAIATLQHQGSWLVYLDNVLQPNSRFATAEEALDWLRCRIDQPQPKPGTFAWAKALALADSGPLAVEA